MAKLVDYAKMSAEVYKVPDCKSVHQWKLVHSKKGSAAFKGACYISADEMVVVFAGTELAAAEIVQDFTADVLLGLGLPTRQASEASLFFDEVMTHKGRRRHVTIAGHSLGGGLAQAVGYAKTAHFVTFNAPGMMQSILCTGVVVGVGALVGSMVGHHLRRSRAGDHGKNYRLPMDPVSLINTHYGSAPILVSGGREHTGHGIATFISCLESGPWRQHRPFKY